MSEAAQYLEDRFTCLEIGTIDFFVEGNAFGVNRIYFNSMQDVYRGVLKKKKKNPKSLQKNPE